MNYTQITIKGKLVGLKFGMYVSRKFSEALNQGKELISGDNLNELGIAYVLFFGYQCNCEAKDIDGEFTKEDFMDLVDDSADGNLEIAAAIKCWIDTRIVQKAIDAAGTNKDEPKKKSTGKISKG